MSGGQRNQRKRKQQQRQQTGTQRTAAGRPTERSASTPAGKAVRAARSTNSSRNQMFAGIAVVVVLAVAVIGGVFYMNSQSSADEEVTRQIRAELRIGAGGVPQREPAAEQIAPRITEAGVVEEGSPDAPLTVNVYEDFICPYCGELYQQSHREIERAVDSGQIKVRYHLVNFLDDASSPPGYSTRAANAAMCSVDSGDFRQYYGKLFGAQPAEGGPGYSETQLIGFGKQLGAGQDFASCVRQHAHAGEVRTASAAARQKLTETSPTGEAGTPSVVVANRQIPALGKPEWLRQLIGPQPRED